MRVVFAAGLALAVAGCASRATPLPEIPVAQLVVECSSDAVHETITFDHPSEVVGRTHFGCGTDGLVEGNWWGAH